MESLLVEHKVIDVRASGMMPDAVGEAVQHALDAASDEGWELHMIQPIIYNSSTTGYLLLIFRRPRPTQQ